MTIENSQSWVEHTKIKQLPRIDIYLEIVKVAGDHLGVYGLFQEMCYYASHDFYNCGVVQK